MKPLVITVEHTICRSLIIEAIRRHNGAPELIMNEEFCTEIATAMIKSQLDVLDYEAVYEMWNNDVLTSIFEKHQG